MHRETLLDLDQVPVGPGGDPCTYGLDGQPITHRQAIELLEDVERRTLRKTPITLPSGTTAVVRTLCMVYDDAAASGPVPDGHIPQIYGSVLYTPEPLNLYMQALWTYGSRAEAEAGHKEAVDEYVSGRAHVPA